MKVVLVDQIVFVRLVTLNFTQMKSLRLTAEVLIATCRQISSKMEIIAGVLLLNFQCIISQRYDVGALNVTNVLRIYRVRCFH